jgi:uncharacterized protein YlxW (UPF0749 family)
LLHASSNSNWWFSWVCSLSYSIKQKGDGMMKVPANEMSREELLTRDVSILLQEVRQLRKENEELKQMMEKERVEV